MVVKNVIWHNPRCSKSRQALELLHQNKIFPTIRLYLKDPPTKTEIKEVLKLLRLTAIDLIRKKEIEYKLLDESTIMDQDQLIEVLTKMPILIERPIIILHKKAIIARPPSLIHEIV